MKPILTPDPCPSRSPEVRVQSVPFSRIPGQSRLFLDYLADPTALRAYYPNAVGSPYDVAGYRDTVLGWYKTDRRILCDALARINRDAGAGIPTLANIEMLRRPDAVAVVTGQQAGLFTGPVYTLYKALSALRLAEELRRDGVNAIAVFWIANEDHDLDEIDHASVTGNGDGLARVSYRPNEFTDGASVGEIRLDDGIAASIRTLLSVLGRTEFSTELTDKLAGSYASGGDYGTSFSRLLMSLLGSYGLVVVDPLDETLKQLVTPIYYSALEAADEIVTAIRQRSETLEAAGYHAQVRVEEEYFPFFWHDDSGRRLALRRLGDGKYRVKGEKIAFTREDLLSACRSDPSRFSPGVMLRPVVQDFLLPTLCYFGGGAEIAYFAQNSGSYRVLGRPVTPIFHRQSFTVIEPREKRNLKRFGWDLSDLFGGKEAAIIRAAEDAVKPDLPSIFRETQSVMDAELDRLGKRLEATDGTVGASLERRRRHIGYHIETLRKKALRAAVVNHETERRRIDTLFDSLWPNGGLQERELNVMQFLNKYGPNFLDWLYQAVDLRDSGHRIIEL